MALFRIIDLPAIGGALVGADLFEVWDDSAAASRRITATDMAAFFGGGGGSQDLDSVLGNGNISQQTIILDAGPLFGQTTTYKGNGMENAGYQIDMIDGAFSVIGPQASFIFDNSGNRVDFLEFDRVSVSGEGDVMMDIIKGAGGVVNFNPNIFAVGSPIQPLLSIDKTEETTTFFSTIGSELLRFDLANDEAIFNGNTFLCSTLGATFTTDNFTVGSTAFPNMVTVNGVGGGFDFTGVDFGVNALNGMSITANRFFVSGGASTFDMTSAAGIEFILGNDFVIRAGSPLKNVFLVDSSIGNAIVIDTRMLFKDSTGLNNLFEIDQGSDRLIAYAAIINTDITGDYIKCGTPAGPRKIRLEV